MDSLDSRLPYVIAVEFSKRDAEDKSGGCPDCQSCICGTHSEVRSIAVMSNRQQRRETTKSYKMPVPATLAEGQSLTTKIPLSDT